MKNFIYVIYSTNNNDDEIKKYNEHISKTIGCKHIIKHYKNNNQYSLTEIYNKSIKDYYRNNNEIFVFIHDDLIFKTRDWGKILLRKFNNFNVDIIGLAGSDHLSNNGIWWSKKETMYGVVEHTNGVSNWVNDYNSNFKGLKEVVVVDGLFIAVNFDRVIHIFNEDFEGFHFYEIPFCVDNYIDGSEIRVTNEIRVLHKSIGQTNDEWEKSRIIFIDKYKQYLPITIND